jgi:hypothetical protein
MGTRWGGEDAWSDRRGNFLEQAPHAPQQLGYQRYDGPFDQMDEDQRRQLAVNSMVVAAGLGDYDDPPGRRDAYQEAVFPMDFLGDELQNRAAAVAGCPGASSCGTFIRGSWQLLGAGDPNIFSPPTADRGLRGSYDSNNVFSQIASWANDCGALHGRYVDTGGASIAGTPLALDDPNSWKAADVIFLWNPSANAQHIFTLTAAPTASGDGSWDLATVDGGSATGAYDGGCMGVSTNSRSVDNVQRKLVVHIGRMFGDGDVAFWIDFSKVRFTDPDVFVRVAGGGG